MTRQISLPPVKGAKRRSKLDALKLGFSLGDEQREVVTRAFRGEHMFVTGRAGTGKSAVLKAVNKLLPDTAVVAPTGVAAINCGGATIHKFFDLSARFYNPGEAMRDIKPEPRSRIAALSTLIIDEVSMVRADLMNAMDDRLRSVKDMPDTPFGGVQVIMFGDLFQLDPVVQKSEEQFMAQAFGGKYFFNASVFSQVHIPMMELTAVYRQKGDDGFLDILDDIRKRRCDPRCLELLNSRVVGRHRDEIIAAHSSPFPITEGRIQAQLRPGPKKDPDATVIAFTKRDVKKYNDAAVQAATGEGDEVFLISGRTFNFPEHECPTPLHLELKVGTRVMATRNNYAKGGEALYINGSQGTVMGFEVFTERHIESAKERAKRDGKKCYITDDDLGKVRKVKVKFDDLDYTVGVELAKWAKVEYSVITNADGEEELKDNEVGSLHQFPLRVSYAITAHRSQGLTLNKIHFDPGRGSFAHGQSYVALSRCTSLEGVTLARPITEKDVIMDDVVLSYYNSQIANRVAPLEDGLTFETMDPWSA